VLQARSAVAFGASGEYNYVTVTGSTSCDLYHFGGDPVAGTPKACYATPLPN
jgi:hypothetical protein